MPNSAPNFLFQLVCKVDSVEDKSSWQFQNDEDIQQPQENLSFNVEGIISLVMAHKKMNTAQFNMIQKSISFLHPLESGR